ncbi:MAG: pirin family protein [Draconibacterium sp.]|nr:pirin family protein [Draconibacterium sp.]
MNTIIHKASQRGFADHGWLKAAHSFSFANYFDNEKIHFGKLRVLNDDLISPARGFDLHPHQDMEIITIPLSGALRHTDNMGNEEIISTGEVQVMSAGTGIWHSEFNASKTFDLSLFQIWIFTIKKGLKPGYNQKKFDETERVGKWQLLVSPNGQNNALSINQSAYISIIEFSSENSTIYHLNEHGNGVYFMLIEGEAEITGNTLQKRDAIGVWNIIDSIEINFTRSSKLLAIEVPMN